MIVNRFIPFRGFTAINLFGLIFVRKGMPFTAADLRHERIHTRQMLELLVIPFYMFYVLEWLVRLVQHRNLLRAYLSISFEREAYKHQHDSDYLAHRRHYAWLKELF
ncbi:MAG: hypothetical protein K6A32_00105 [Bacteroidales bacterium]|nr:hypothetical protein [Bacteroidales bacterium]